MLRADITAEDVLDLGKADLSDPVYDPDRYDTSRALGAEAHQERPSSRATILWTTIIQGGGAGHDGL